METEFPRHHLENPAPPDPLHRWCTVKPCSCICATCNPVSQAAREDWGLHERIRAIVDVEVHNAIVRIRNALQASIGGLSYAEKYELGVARGEEKAWRVAASMLYKPDSGLDWQFRRCAEEAGQRVAILLAKEGG